MATPPHDRLAQANSMSGGSVAAGPGAAFLTVVVPHGSPLIVIVSVAVVYGAPISGVERSHPSTLPSQSLVPVSHGIWPSTQRPELPRSAWSPRVEPGTPAPQFHTTSIFHGATTVAGSARAADMALKLSTADKSAPAFFMNLSPRIAPVPHGEAGSDADPFDYPNPSGQTNRARIVRPETTSCNPRRPVRLRYTFNAAVTGMSGTRREAARERFPCACSPPAFGVRGTLVHGCPVVPNLTSKE